MARKKRTVKRRSTKRRSKRMSGLGAIDFTNILAVIAGSVGSQALNQFIPETIDKKIVSGGKVALGVALPLLVKSGKMKNIVSGVGAGMLAQGSAELLKELGVLGALGIVDNVSNFSTWGMQNQNVLGASVLANRGFGEDLNVINGVDQGYDNDQDLNVINGLDDLAVINGF